MKIRSFFLIYFLLAVYANSVYARQFYDCFTFYNELELLKVRLEELFGLVDYFVIVEAKQTFAGDAKPLYFLESEREFEKYRASIIHVIVDEFPPSCGDPSLDRWVREEFQRNAILRGLTQCDPDDIVLIADVDEIPNRKAISQIKRFFQRNFDGREENQHICALHMRLFLFYLNYESAYGWKEGAKAAPYWLVQKKLPWNIKILHLQDPNLPKLYGAGWHFHCMGGEDKIQSKLGAIYKYLPEKDFPGLNDLGAVEDWKARVQDFMQWESRYFHPRIVPIDDSYPKYIRENRDRFQDLGWFIGSK